MAAPPTQHQTQVTLDTPITLKVFYQGSTKKFKVPLKDLNANVFEQKLRGLLEVPEGSDAVFERFSDSVGTYVRLDRGNTQVYKTLFRAAKAKLKLRLKATIVPTHSNESEVTLAETVDSRSTVENVPVASVSSHAALQEDAVKDMDSAKGESTAVDVSQGRGLEIRTLEVSPVRPNWTVFCNACDRAMQNEHFHCNICDNADYDLCKACVDKGIHCFDQEHWLIKRFVKDGAVIISSTEKFTATSKAHQAPQTESPAPARPVTASKTPEVLGDTRTCNSCVKVFPEHAFVTCKDCEDYDLCIPCHVAVKHGHHPGHTFEPATAETKITPQAEYLCTPGRNARHAAVCDGCDKFIYGIRHKCLNCPDWDYCSKCVKSAKFIHAGHRFAPIYDPLPDVKTRTHRHIGIYCDGELCKPKEGQQYIEGVRYKCAVCHDVDFCANCEASPNNRHNRTHPLIMFKTPVRSVHITTTGEDRHGSAMPTMGDKPSRRSMSTETTPVISSNASTQVQTVAEVKPMEQRKPKVEKITIKDLLTESKPEMRSLAVEENDEELNAKFERDTIADGMKVLPGLTFPQVWTMSNPGPKPWPTGCSIRYVGGDNMLNVDDNQISTAAEINEATESNVLQRPVAAGETVSFKIMMKAPQRSGTAISYWRLKAADGTPFGHRLWCHIEVLKAAPVPSPAPESALSAQRKLVMLEQQNRARLIRAHMSQESLAKQHQIMRQQTIEQMRQASARMDEELQRINAINADTIAATRSANKMPELAATPTAPVSIAVAAPVAATDFSLKNDNVAEDIKSETTTEVEGEPSSSRMIFPTLDKESPVSSTHEAVTAPEANVAAENTETETIMSPSVKSEGDFFEDAETIDYSDNESFDDFATDDEYDILDASDQEQS